MSQVMLFALPKKKLMIGQGCAGNVGADAKAFGVKKVVVMTDVGVEKAGLAGQVKASLEKEGIKAEIWNKVEPEPSIETFGAAAEEIRGKYDMIVGVGGGSTMDMSKVAAALATNTGNPKDYIGIDLLKNNPLPSILIPTTSGTGSEVDCFAMVKDGTRKVWIGDWKMVTNIALVDPLMTKGMPPRLTAMTGIDALAQLTTGVIGTWSNLLVEPLALQGIRLVGENLRKAVFNGEDIQARNNMCIAATLGGISMDSAMTALDHALAHVIGGHTHLPHGLLAAIILPYALEYNLPVVPEKIAKIASAMGENISGLSAREAANKGIESVKTLIEDVVLKTSLKDQNVPKNLLPKIVDDIVTGKGGQDLLVMMNPRKVTKEELTCLCERIWEGE